VQQRADPALAQGSERALAKIMRTPTARCLIEPSGPIAIVYFDDARVLAAWCERRSAFRHFRVDRLQLTTVLEERYPGRRQSLARQWRQQDRDWRSMMTVSDTSGRYPSTGAVAPGAL